MQPKLQELADLKFYRDDISGALRNYSCVDPRSVTSEPIYSATERFIDRTVKVDTLLERDSANIWVTTQLMHFVEINMKINHFRFFLCL